MKKTKLVPGVAIALTVLCGSAALAQSPEEKQRGRGPEPGPPWAAARFLFQRFDEDRNRSLEEE